MTKGASARVDVKDDVVQAAYEIHPSSDEDDLDDDELDDGSDLDADELDEPASVSSAHHQHHSPTIWTNNDASLTSPNLDNASALAKRDIDAFLLRYYLDDARMPDPRKTQSTICLRGLSRAQLHALDRAINESFIDLFSKICGTSQEKLICIGWDRAAVHTMAAEFDSKRFETRARAYAAMFAAH